MSSMLLQTNGKESSSKRTKHIHIGAGHFTIKHCPTNDMLPDHLTKPLQGSQFRKLHSKIQGIPEDMNDALMGWDRPSLKTKPGFKTGITSPHECVGTKADRTNENTPVLLKILSQVPIKVPLEQSWPRNARPGCARTQEGSRALEGSSRRGLKLSARSA
jgi:hypothetical protein